MKTIGILFVVLVLALGALLLYPILKQRPRFPTITAPQQLLAECAHISDTAPAGAVPRAKWGPAILSLNPRHVVFRNKRVGIILSTGGIGDSWGFVVFPDLRTEAPSADDASRFRMIEPGIFTFR